MSTCSDEGAEVRGGARGIAGARRTGTAGVPLVWKFGGTSVGDQDRLRAVAERMVAARRGGRGVVAVLSAMGKSTDELVRQAYAMSARPPLRELDALLSVGESISCALAAMAVTELGVRAVSLSGAQAGIGTDDRHGAARMVGIDPRRIHDELATGAIVLVTGFQGVSAGGDVTTLGRGGSDASAVALAAALGARECDIFTDVPAVFTADPRVVPDARRLASVRPEEMLELAEAGAAVLQPRAVELALASGVDIHLRSSTSEEEGTWIRREAAGPAGAGERSEVAGIAHRRQENRYRVAGTDAARVLAALAERGIAAGAVLAGSASSDDTGTDGVGFTAPGAEPAEVAAALAAAGLRAQVEELGSVSVVHLGMAREPDIPARALAALEQAGIAPRMVTTTPNRVTVLVPPADVEDAVRLLHRTFVPAASAVTELRAPAEAA